MAIVLVTDTLNLKVSVILLLLLQIGSAFFHIKRIYSSRLLYLQIFVFRELNLLANVLIMVISVFKDSEAPVLGMVTGGINMSMVALFALS